MSIPETFYFDKEGEVIRNPLFKRFFLTICIVLVAVLAFGIGRLTSKEGSRVVINYDQKLVETASVSSYQREALVKEGEVVASVNGTRYYFSHCYNNISPNNKIVFENATMAEKAGYTLAKNCSSR